MKHRKQRREREDGGTVSRLPGASSALPSSLGRTVARSMHAAAAEYAEGDRTDPFAFRRAMSHMLNGVATSEHYGRSFRP